MRLSLVYISVKQFIFIPQPILISADFENNLSLSLSLSGAIWKSEDELFFKKYEYRGFFTSTKPTINFLNVN